MLNLSMNSKKGKRKKKIMVFSKYQLEPAFTADGKIKWWQLCYVCSGQINFIKAVRFSWVSIGNGMVRHKKCNPPPLK